MYSLSLFINCFCIIVFCFFFLVEDPFLVVVRDSIIYGISLNPEEKSNDAMVPVAGLQNGYDVDFDDNEQTIYWVEHPVSYCPKTLNVLLMQCYKVYYIFNISLVFNGPSM